MTSQIQMKVNECDISNYEQLGVIWCDTPKVKTVGEYISLSAKSCAFLVALGYLTHLVIFLSVHVGSACMYLYRMYQASKMARRLD
jgi:hypothetical protein